MFEIIKESIFIGLIGGILALIGVILLWPRKGKFGINLGRTYCPACGNKLPIIRKPKSEFQKYYGGWTCSKCGSEIDRYGKLLNEHE